MFDAGAVAELGGAVRLQREADRRTVVFVEARLRGAQVAAADDGHVLHQVVDDGAAVGGAAARRRPAGSRRPAARRRWPSAALASSTGPCSTSFSSSSDVERMISFARATSVTPGSCTMIWS